MKVTESQIRAWINEYKNKGYYEAASNRSWDNMYIHAPKSKYYINGVPCCAIWKKEVEANMPKLQSFSDFDKLLCELKKLKNEKKLKGIGDLMIYDTATCLGSRPDRIYIHAGVKDGLKALYEEDYKDIEGSASLTLDLFFERFPFFKDSGLKAIHIEDFLCIYHHDLNNESDKGEKARKFVRENYRKCSCCR